MSKDPGSRKGQHVGGMGGLDQPERAVASVRSAREEAVPVTGGAAGSGPPRPAPLRSVHLEMVEAVLRGDGLDRVAELAAAAAGAPVVILVPRLGLAVGATATGVPLTVPPGGPPPGAVVERAAIGADGAVMLLQPGGDAEVLRLASVASLTELALADARDEAVQTVRGSLLDDVAAGRADPHTVGRRAARLGCALDDGLVALCAELATSRPRHLVATVTGDWPGVLAEVRDDGRLLALLPATGSGEQATLEAAAGLAARLRRSGPVGLSGFFAKPAAAVRAMQEAALVLDVARRDGQADPARFQSGTYRLLSKVFASRPDELAAFYEETIAPLAAYDERYGSALVQTLESYFEHDLSMAVAAGALLVHRHTVAYRLDRVRELTGLDPLGSEDRERLGLGLKAYRILQPAAGRAA